MPVSSAFPTALDVLTQKVQNVDYYNADDMNICYDILAAIEAKVGINGSADTQSVDYLLKSASSVNPGHLHNKLTNVAPPAGSSSPGSVGQISWDSSRVYICVGTNTWKRVSWDTSAW